MGRDYAHVLAEKTAALFSRRETLSREIAERQAAVRRVDQDLALLDRVRQRAGIALESTGIPAHFPLTALSGGKRRIGAREHVVRLLRQRPHGASMQDVYHQLEYTIDSDAKDKRRLLSNTLCQLKHDGKVALIDGVYTLVENQHVPAPGGKQHERRPPAGGS
jgi:hypothetical protein